MTEKDLYEIVMDAGSKAAKKMNDEDHQHARLAILVFSNFLLDEIERRMRADD